MLVTYLKVHQPPVEVDERRIDYGGIVTLSLALVFLLVGMDQAADWGWGDPRVVAMFAAAVVLAIGFAFVEPRMKAAALVPGDIIRNRPFTAACLATLLMSAVFFTTVLYAPQLMQKILGYSPLKSGVGMLPMLAVFAVTSFVAGPLYNRVGGKAVVTAGSLGLVVGPFLLSRFGADSEYTALVPGLVITGLGVGLFYPSVTTAAVTALDPSRSSLAGGIVYMFQIAGGAVGLGLATTIFTTTSQSQVADDALKQGLHLSEGQADVVHGSLAGTDTGAAGDPPVPECRDQAPRRGQRVVRLRRLHRLRGDLGDRGRRPGRLAALRRRVAARPPLARVICRHHVSVCIGTSAASRRSN